jgi:hypothetical protein
MDYCRFVLPVDWCRHAGKLLLTFSGEKRARCAPEICGGVPHCARDPWNGISHRDVHEKYSLLCSCAVANALVMTCLLCFAVRLCFLIQRVRRPVLYLYDAALVGLQGVFMTGCVCVCLRVFVWLQPTDGLVRVLAPNTPFPLIGGWLPGEDSVRIVSNNMYNAPLFQHSPKPSDFLVVFSISRRHDYPRIKKAYLR